jgi:hypothetical protein
MKINSYRHKLKFCYNMRKIQYDYCFYGKKIKKILSLPFFHSTFFFEQM